MAKSTTTAMFDRNDFRSISQEMISEVPDASPSFILWAKTAFETGDIERFIHTITRFGLANSVQDSLLLLNEVCEGINDPQLALCDINGDSNYRRRGQKKVHDMFHEVDIDNLGLPLDNHRLYGTIGHAVAPHLALKNLPIAANDFTPSLFNDDLFLPKYDVLVRHNEIKNNKNARKQYLKDLFDLWKDLSYMRNIEALSYLKDLRELMTPFFMGYSQQIRKGSFSWYELQTLRTWAAWLLRSMREKEWYVFHEIPALDRRWGVPSGRIDAVRVISISGRPPTEAQGRKLKKMTECRYPSVGWLVLALTGQFGHDIELGIIDWKFAVGDCPVGDREIQINDVIDKPPSCHRSQIRRYVTFANIDTILCQNILDGIDTNLESLVSGNCRYLFNDSYFSQACLVYLFPEHTQPMIHGIDVSASAQQAHLAKTLDTLPKARDYATVRASNNLIVRFITNELYSKKKKDESKVLTFDNLFTG